MSGTRYHGDSLFDQAKELVRQGAKRASENYRAREALELVTDDLAIALVPFPEFPCQTRLATEILDEISTRVRELRDVAAGGGDVTFGAELLRRLAVELAGSR